MARIIGVDIPNEKRLCISLTYLYGIGRTLAMEVISKLGLDPNMKAKELTQTDIARMNSLLQEEFMVEGDLRRFVQNNIKRLMAIQSYRGLRHRLGLPVRGQRTSCNARTRKGRGRTIANKKK
ncbi:MAG: 30S ribosomal protein S13 [Waddliaceae bacterium]|nr:30S ribosomal protein S13 [Waddliaceae bacterium]